MRLTIIAGLIMGLALGIHSVIGTHAAAIGEHAAAVQAPHVSRARVHRNRIYLRSTAAELDTRAEDAARARVRRTTTAIILWTIAQRS
jgi:hypothetical protein